MHGESVLEWCSVVSGPIRELLQPLSGRSHSSKDEALAYVVPRMAGTAIPLRCADVLARYASSAVHAVSKSHLHVFHHHAGYNDVGRGGMPPPQHGGNSGSNNMSSMMYGGGSGGGNAPTSPVYGGGGAAYSNNKSSIPPHMMSPSPHPQIVGMGNEYAPRMQSSPYPQQQQQGGGASTPNSIGRRVRTPGPFVNSAPQQPQPGMMRGDGGYGPDVDNSPPPQNNGYRAGQPPPPPQQHQQQMHMQSSPLQPQHYQGNGGYGGGGGRGMGGGMQNPNMQMQPPPQQQQQMMGGGSASNSANPKRVSAAAGAATDGWNAIRRRWPGADGGPWTGPMMQQSGGVPGMYGGSMDANMMGGMGGPPMPGYMDADPRGDLAPQQTLYEFLMEKRLLRKTTLGTFFPEDYDPKCDSRITIAVDGNYMITNLRAQLQRTDPLINGDVEAFLPSPDELHSRDAVWAKLNEGIELPTQDEITEAFETSSAVGEDVLRAIQRFLRTEENVVCVTAPFLNWCQMCTLHKEGIAQLLMGPPEMLMVPYDDMKVIAEVNLQTSEVAYYDRDEVLRELFPRYVTETSTAAAGDRFLDFGLLIASHPAITTAHASVQLSTQSIYEELSTPHPSFNTLREFIDQYEYPQNQNERPNLEKLKHSKGRTYIQYSPVFSNQVTSESSLVYFKRILDPSLTNANMPNNLSGVFGYLVPLSLFYFQFTGLLSVGLMTAVTQLYIRDEFPVADTEEYHHLLHPLMALRGQIISQMVSRIKADAHGQRLGKISWVRWFDSILMSVLPPDRLIVLDEWNLKNSPELASVPDDQLENIDMSMVLSLKSSVMCIPAPQLPANASPRDAPILYHGKKETFFAILLKTFDFVGYFSHSADPMDGAELASEPVQAMVQGQSAPDDQSNGPDGGKGDLVDSSSDPNMSEQRVFFTAYLSISLEHCPQEFQCALVRFTELVRVSTINSIAFTFADTIELQHDEDGALADPPEVLLATRIACLVSVPYEQKTDEESEFEWAPVYSRQLCAFTVMSRVMNRSLRVLTEAIAAALFLSGFSDCSLEDYDSMTPLLPFGDVPGSLGGLLLHYVLVFPPDYEANCQTPEERCRLLETKFKAIPNIQTQLRRVMEFTFHALYLLNVYILRDPSIVSSPELVETDVVANALNLLHEKWVLHLDGPAPEDVHGYFQFE
ncbi:Temperature dependent protein affecting M2 dsRNA replication family protein [Leishmania donovani]|uniref:Temperature dependent protein affecting M2 dsRNA replication family protein n=1 Tax=Leishmania donovani TaxID=5661 RepID=A0A504XZX6_LEIDO|nr:Temperature dependent protein affecting M2 dsRNA replication family protein [Leishmania donovani]